MRHAERYERGISTASTARAGLPAALRAFLFQPYVLVLLLCVPALVPMLAVPFWQSHDGLHHIFRLANFDETLRSGVLFPRWADQLGFGYGFPVTQYYAPLAYYLADVFHLAGAGYLDSIKLSFALGVVMSGLGMYLLARQWLGVRAAILSAAAYVYYPYHTADIYMRGTLTEFSALALLPPIVWAATRIVQNPVSADPRPASTGERFRSVLIFAILLAALILTHNLTAFLFLPVLALFLLVVATGQPRTMAQVGRWTLDIALGTVLALSLSAFYWLPALGEVAWIRAGQVSGSVDDIASQLTPLTQFVTPSFLQPYVADAPASIQHPLNLSLVLVCLASAIVAWLGRRHFSPGQRRVWWAWLLIALLTTLALLDVSAPLWSAVPALAFVQFPYRLHAFLGLALAMLVGLGAQAGAAWLGEPLGRRATRIFDRARIVLRHIPGAVRVRGDALASIAVVALLIWSSLAALPITAQTLPGHKEPIVESQVNLAGMSEYDYQTALWARLYGGPWLLEYLPAWVTEAREDFFLPPGISRPAGATQGLGAQLQVLAYRPEQRLLRVQNAVPFVLSFHTFYFPAWQVRVDDQPVPLFPSGPLGLLSAEVPAGDHRVTLSFDGAPLQRTAQWLSLVAAALVLCVLLLRGQHRKLWFSTLLLVLTGVLGWRSFDVRMMQGPQSVSATFEDQIDLLAYGVGRESYRPGDVVDVTLYWFARQTPTENFKVFVHLDPSAGLLATGVGRRAGQVDMQPGMNFSPTTRWQRGEVFSDHYRLRIAPDAAPGDYDLYTGLYRPQPLQNLHVLSPSAVPGDRVRLGTLSVGRP